MSRHCRGMMGLILALGLLVGCNKKAATPAGNAQGPNVAEAQPLQNGRADQKSGTVYPGWGQLYDPLNDTQVHLAGGKLTMVVPPGLHDINPQLGGMHAPRILQEVRGNFNLEVTVTGEFAPGPKSAKDGVASFNGAGLSLWLDDKNYLRFERNAWWNAAMNNYQCYTPLYEVFVNGVQVPTSPGIGPAENFFRGNSTRFRLRREGSTLMAAYSFDGVEWQEIPRLAANLPNSVYVGIGAVSTSEQPFAVVFENFQLTQK